MTSDYAQQYNVKFKVVSYQKEQQAIQAFDDGKCSGLAASNFKLINTIILWEVALGLALYLITGLPEIYCSF